MEDDIFPFGAIFGPFAVDFAVSSRNRSRAPRIGPSNGKRKKRRDILQNPKGNVKLFLLYPFIVQIMWKGTEHTQKFKKLFVRNWSESKLNYQPHSIIDFHHQRKHTCLKCTEGIGAACVADVVKHFHADPYKDVPLRSLFMDRDTTLLSFPCKWVTRGYNHVISLFIGVITPFVTSDGAQLVHISMIFAYTYVPQKKSSLQRPTFFLN